MRNLFFVTVSVLLTMLSCRSAVSEYNIINQTLPLEDTLHGTEIETGVNIYRPSHVIEVDDHILVYDHVDSGMFKVFKMPGMEYLYSWGQKGDHPGGFTLIDPKTLVSYDSNMFEFVDYPKLKRYSMKGDSIILENVTELPQPGYSLNRLTRVNDSIYFANGPDLVYDDEHISLDVKESTVLEGFGSYFKTKHEAHSPLYRYLNLGKEAISNKAGTRFVTFYYYLKKIKIYNGEGKLLTLVNYGDSPTATEVINKRRQELEVFPIQAYGTKNLIYALIANRSGWGFIDEVGFMPQLGIWDWEGNFIGSYLLDKPITGFMVMEDSKILYGLSPHSLGKIYQYQLPI